MDWERACIEGEAGRLQELMSTLPREYWTERSDDGQTLLHLACRGANVAAMVALIGRGVNVNACTDRGWSPAHHAAYCGQKRALEVLCATGALLHGHNKDGNAPLDLALLVRHKHCVRALVANGVRLSSVRAAFQRRMTPDLDSFERGVLRCRAAVVAMLRVKRASGKLWMWDKFLLACMARDVWTTRCDEQWSQE